MAAGMDLLERSDAETRHPWELARARFFLEVLKKDGALARGGRVLDAGAGDAWFATELLRRLDGAGEVTCWDAHYRDEDVAAIGARGVVATAERPRGPFDLLLLLDVIEHVEDDRGFLAGLVSDLLAPGGTALVSVPAWQLLYSKHDEALKHHRRYAPEQCRAVLEDAGLSIIMSGGLFHGLLLPRAASVFVEKLRAAAGPPPNLGAWRGGRVVTKAIAGALFSEGLLSLALAERGVDVPGLSFWALCRRPP